MENTTQNHAPTEEDFKGLLEDGPLDDVEQTHGDPAASDNDVHESETEQTRLFKFGEKELDRETLLKELDDDTLDNALNAHERKAAWEKSLTEKAQKRALEKKLIQPVLDFKSKLSENEELRNGIDELWKDLTESDEGISHLLMNEDLDKIENPFKAELDELKTELDSRKEAEAKAKVDDELNSEIKVLKTGDKDRAPLTDRQIETLATEAADRYEEDGVLLSLQEVLRLNHPDWGRKRTPLRTNSNQSKSTSDVPPKRPTSYSEISVKEFATLME